jgi:hypothetical protein
VPQRSPTAAAARLAVALVVIMLLATMALVAGLLLTHRGAKAKAAGARTTGAGLKLDRLAGTWALGPALPAEGPNELPAMLSCGSTVFCVAMDQEGASAWVYRAGKWDFDAHAGPAGGFGTITGLQCFADETCTATDAEADLITYKGGAWAAKHGPTANGGGPMGCASPALCLFVDGVGQSYTWDGKAFSKPKVAYPSLANTMGSGAGYIACASGSTFCAVADQLGYLGTYAGGHWSPLARPFGLIAPLGAACVSSTECVAPFRPGNGRPGHGPAAGDWAVWDGAHWGANAGGAHGFPDADAQIGSTMSCAAGLCMGLDNQHGRGLVGYAYNGRSWSVTGPFGNGTKAPALLACASSKWCLALYVGQGTSPSASWVFHPAAG